MGLQRLLIGIALPYQNEISYNSHYFSYRIRLGNFLIGLLEFEYRSPFKIRHDRELHPPNSRP
jgi:hypothetical protein